MPWMDEEQSGGREVSKPNWRLYKALQRAREREEKEMASSMSASVSPKSVKEDLQTGLLENKLSTLQKVVFDAVQGKKLLSLLVFSIAPPHSSHLNAFKHHTKTLTRSKSCWLYTDRRTRSDAIPTEHRKLVHDFWSSPGVSRPTGNKKDMVRKRLAVRTFVSHPKQILYKTQAEVFLELKAKYPGIKMGQRSLERCKPFYVIAPRSQDKITCWC